MAFEVFEHTADIGLQMEADDLDSLFADAARGLFTVVRGENPVAPQRSLRAQAEADDLVRLLVRFLNEFVFLMDSEGVVLHDVTDVHVTRQGEKWKAAATVTGEAFSHEKHPGCLHVKAVTKHTAQVEAPHEGRRATARVILDV